MTINHRFSLNLQTTNGYFATLIFIIYQKLEMGKIFILCKGLPVYQTNHLVKTILQNSK